MGILGNLFGQSEDDGSGSDWGTRLALMGQVLMAADQGQVANIAPSLAVLNERRRKLSDEAKTTKWLQNQAASMADKNPRLAGMLQDAPPEVSQSLISRYYETMLQPPEWKTFENGQGDVMRYNPNDPNSKPELFYDTPDDPLTQLVKGVIGEGSGGPSPSGATSIPPAPGMPPSASSGAPEMPPASGDQGSLSGQAAILAQGFGLPENATLEDVKAVAQAQLFGGPEQARATAETIRKRYADGQSQDFELTKQQKENSFKLFDDYRGIGERYQKIMDTATEVASLPDDPSGFERIMILYKTMKTLDPGGAVMAADTGLAQSAATPLERMDQLFQKYSGVSGTDIPLPAAQEMKRLVLELGEIASKADYVKRKSILRRAENLGIPADKAEGMIFGFLQENADALEGYTPRFTPGPRPGDAQTDAGGGEAELEWTPSGGVR